MDDGQQQRVFRAPLPADSAGAGPSVPAQALAVPPSTSRTITDTIIGGEYRGEKEEKGGRRRISFLRPRSSFPPLLFLGERLKLATDTLKPRSAARSERTEG
jgi:hypothetical protein